MIFFETSIKRYYAISWHQDNYIRRSFCRKEKFKTESFGRYSQISNIQKAMRYRRIVFNSVYNEDYAYFSGSQCNKKH